ncbi:hypothetical protein P691DRAFT_30624 [Macrolepiota fuliginosa MF-IS2]|uniref:Uncharacterized protein n=1 Tax=Macrolepiota fuliginosa MF-IS2 TaxID=1400762 RepID=A0A9P5XE74_9AGAR|nr:hypothetical protein P691DRAFT_30624 [Macrolepiota fuliginosa MF-IS2]
MFSSIFWTLHTFFTAAYLNCAPNLKGVIGREGFVVAPRDNSRVDEICWCFLEAAPQGADLGVLILSMKPDCSAAVAA